MSDDRKDILERLGRIDRREEGSHLIGFDFSDAFGLVHGVGKGVLSAFGAGAAAGALEDVEKSAGLLPGEQPVQAPNQPAAPTEPAQSAPPPPPTGAVVTQPDYIVLIRQDKAGKKAATGVPGLKTVTVKGGTRFEGNGYQSGDAPGKTFSFGYDHPTRIETIDSKGKRYLVSAKQIMFLGGSEKVTIDGDVANKIEEEIAGWGFLDTLAAVLTGGSSAAISIPVNQSKEMWADASKGPRRDDHDAPKAQDYTKSAAYTSAQAKLKAAQKAQADAAANLAQKKAVKSSYVPVQSTVPSFQLAPLSLPSPFSGQVMVTPPAAPAAVDTTTATTTAPAGGDVPLNPNAGPKDPDPLNPGFLVDGTPIVGADLIGEIEAVMDESNISEDFIGRLMQSDPKDIMIRSLMPATFAYDVKHHGLGIYDVVLRYPSKAPSLEAFFVAYPNAPEQVVNNAIILNDKPPENVNDSRAIAVRALMPATLAYGSRHKIGIDNFLESYPDKAPAVEAYFAANPNVDENSAKSAMARKFARVPTGFFGRPPTAPLPRGVPVGAVVRCPKCGADLSIVKAVFAGSSTVVGALFARNTPKVGKAPPRAVKVTNGTITGQCPNCGADLKLQLRAAAAPVSRQGGSSGGGLPSSVIGEIEAAL